MVFDFYEPFLTFYHLRFLKRDLERGWVILVLTKIKSLSVRFVGHNVRSCKNGTGVTSVKVVLPFNLVVKKWNYKFFGIDHVNGSLLVLLHLNQDLFFLNKLFI